MHKRGLHLAAMASLFAGPFEIALKLNVPITPTIVYNNFTLA